MDGNGRKCSGYSNKCHKIVLNKKKISLGTVQITNSKKIIHIFEESIGRILLKERKVLKKSINLKKND